VPYVEYEGLKGKARNAYRIRVGNLLQSEQIENLERDRTITLR